MSRAYVLADRVPTPVVVGEEMVVCDYNVTPEQKQRRERMIDFLENECPVEAFDFSTVDISMLSNPAQPSPARAHCGTIGCAMGHARHLFGVSGINNLNFEFHAMELFGLRYAEAGEAFTPDGGRCRQPVELPHAGYDATPQQVATRLREAFRRHPAAI